MSAIQNRPFFCSWSGGKDSCLALYHAVKAGGQARTLLTMLTEDGETSRSHGLPKWLLEEQARQLGLPVVFRSATWNEYEAQFLIALRQFAGEGLADGVFGDIDVEPHREWVRRVCGAAGIAAHHPLWQRVRRALLEEFIDLGFKATIVVVQEDKLDCSFLGRTINRGTVADLERAGVDPSGELGEYHTVVTAGPIFSGEIALAPKGQRHHEGYGFLEW